MGERNNTLLMCEGLPLFARKRRRDSGMSPVTAIRTTSPRIHGVLATNVDHEGAYAIAPVDRSRSVYSDLSDALVFTVRPVVKIAQQVPVP